ncbi:MAG: SpoIID/LytB domain-containing protein [Desulfitobacteriaceae bacterium]
MYRIVSWTAFFLALSCLFIFRPAPCQAKEVNVELVWKLGQAGWVEVVIQEGQYQLRADTVTQSLGPGSSLQFGWGGFAPIWRVNQGPFQFASSAQFEINGSGSFLIHTPEGVQTAYRGGLTLSWARDHWKLTNKLDDEDYLKGVVPIEMSNSWAKDGLEALKAQAVAARTYMAKHTQGGKSLTDSPNIDQAYLGKTVEGAASLAVEMTTAEILTDVRTRQPIDALYSSHDGGYTEDAKNVWGNHDPHYTAKPDPYSKGIGGPAANWHFLISSPELGKNFGLEPVRKIELDKLPSGRVQKVKMEDDGGKVLNVTGRAFVKKFYPYGKPIQAEAFLGTLFDVSQLPTEAPLDSAPRLLPGANEPFLVLPGPRLGRIVSSDKGTLPYNQPYGIFVFHGQGWGHGVGMSQWGAYHMAQGGYTYRDILAFYYDNTVLGVFKS